MALPSIILPEYRIKLLSRNEEIVIRPITVKEEKILLMALEGTTKDIAYAIRQIIVNCTKDSINVDELDFYELIYIFMHIRKISSGEELKSKITVNNEEYDAICDLNKDIKISGLDKLEEFSKPIQLTGNDIFIEVRPMKFKDYIRLTSILDKSKDEDSMQNKVKIMYTTMLLTIKKIYTKEESYDPNDYTLEELENFYESFIQSDKIKIQEKFQQLPKITLNYHYKDKSGKDCIQELDNVDFNFFG